MNIDAQNLDIFFQGTILSPNPWFLLSNWVLDLSIDQHWMTETVGRATHCEPGFYQLPGYLYYSSEVEKT